METKITCPLGSKCVVTDDSGNHLERCAWYVKMQGKDAAGKNHDKWGCAMEWMPIIQTETTGGVMRLQAVVESTRNIQDVRQKEAIEALNKHGALERPDA